MLEATEKRRITWETTKGSNEYKTAVGENSISVRSCETSGLPDNTKGSTYYSLFLWNKDGENIDMYDELQYYSYYSLKNLYEAARRANLKVEETLEEVLSELN